MANYDLNTPDSYASHLAEVNKTHAVVATEDIYNSNGILLVKKGFPIKPEIAVKILNHKLLKPLETSVNVNDAISAQQLFKDIRHLLSQSADYQAIHESLRIDALLQLQCQRYASHALLIQKITVLSLRLPHEYEKALFCAWLSLAIAQHLKLQDAELEAAFVAGLAHDTGMLHISPDIVEKAGDYTAEEWRAVQSHALIGDIFLSHIKGIPEITRRAVREHHERCDGSGYPFGLFENQLSLLGQIVAMTDSLYAIQRKSRNGGKMGLGEIVPILQINSTVHTYQVFAATVQIFRLAQLKGPKPVDEGKIAQFASHLVKQRQALERQYVALKPLAELLSSDSPQKQIRIARLLLDRLSQIAVASGLLNEALGRWYEHVSLERITTARLELAEASILYQEVRWQMSQLARVLELLLSEAQKLPEPARLSIRQVVVQLTPASSFPETLRAAAS